MAVELPTQFIDQDYHHEASSLSKNKSKNTNSSSWSCFGSSDSGSVLNSPLESEVGSTETESEESEEDYMAELSRQMACYMLQDDNNHDDHHHHKQEKVSWSSSAASPPLSTLWPPLGSTHESPKFQSKQSLIDDQIQAIQYYKLNLKQDQPTKKYQNKKTANIIDPQGSNPMRAVFLEGSGSKTKSSSSGGTGVFLPQKIGHASESRKKQGCSTVLIPARVVQALKQHFDKVGAPSRFSENFPLQNDGLLGLKNNSSLNSQQQRPAPVSNHQEIALPQEWTY